jgi:hypothetical protein
MTAFIHQKGLREEVSSLTPYLRESLLHNCLVEPSLMTEDDRHACRWLGYGLGKGVSNPKSQVSVYGIPETMTRGLHGELIQNFPGVDPLPHCYEDNHALGFDGFVRWVYFAHPERDEGILGIDWSLAARKTAGVANSMLKVCALAQICKAHGVPKESELVLLNWRMLEPKYAQKLRHTIGLQSLEDWATHGREVFKQGSVCCPRCGQATLKGNRRFCYRCGCKPELITKE